MDEKEFEAQVAQYHRLVMSLIQRYYQGRLGDRADDLSQEVWLKIWESLKKNETNVVNFKSYLYRTVQTTLWDAIRKVRDNEQDLDLEQQEAPSEAPVGDGLGSIELDQRMAKLAWEDQQMLRAHLQGFNYTEIAALLQTSEGRVRNKLSRLKSKLTD
jgi:RNA polymerase sigma factor (sigma-70 family)